jgi:hypothetical protein
MSPGDQAEHADHAEGLKDAEDSEPAERFPAGLLHVPVRSGPAGCTARFFRTPLGGRTAVGYNLVGRPPVVAVADGIARMLVRRARESLDDLTSSPA